MLKELLTTPTEQLGKWSRFAVFQLRLWPQCVKLLKRNRSGQQAAALSYHTIFGIVPMAIVMLMAFQMFPAYRDVGRNVKAFLYKQVHLSNIEYEVGSETDGEVAKVRLTEKIDEITETFIASLDTRAITVFSIAIVIWAALGLLTTIERAFNGIWHVSRGRNFVHRIVNYWSLLTLGPLLLGLGIYLSTHYLAVGEFEQGVFKYFRPLFPYLVSVVALFFLYFVLPNTKVNVKAALWGAAVAALIWAGAKYAFSMYLTKFIPYKAVYGAMGVIPLSVLWIYITWLIVLFGLQVTYTTQHLKTLDSAEIEAMQKHNDYFVATDFTIIEIMGYILDEFKQRHAPVSVDMICSRLNLPADFVGRILEHLVKTQLLFRTNEPEVGFVLARDGGDITLADISDAADKASFTNDSDYGSGKLKAIMADQHETLAGYTLKQILTEAKVAPPKSPETNS